MKDTESDLGDVYTVDNQTAGEQLNDREHRESNYAFTQYWPISHWCWSQEKSLQLKQLGVKLEASILDSLIQIGHTAPMAH